MACCGIAFQIHHLAASFITHFIKEALSNFKRRCCINIIELYLFDNGLIFCWRANLHSSLLGYAPVNLSPPNLAPTKKCEGLFFIHLYPAKSPTLEGLNCQIFISLLMVTSLALNRHWGMMKSHSHWCFGREAVVANDRRIISIVHIPEHKLLLWSDCLLFTQITRTCHAQFS